MKRNSISLKHLCHILTRLISPNEMILDIFQSFKQLSPFCRCIKNSKPLLLTNIFINHIHRLCSGFNAIHNLSSTFITLLLFNTRRSLMLNHFPFHFIF
ncbi:hypothetical protein QL285_029360 [Trifolium repens]|nr:hypothetical protein QL285_029360 [Trifolium repens]